MTTYGRLAALTANAPRIASSGLWLLFIHILQTLTGRADSLRSLMTRVSTAAVCAVAALALAACGENGTSPDGRPAAVSIDIRWESASVFIGDSLRLPIDALDSAGVFVSPALLRWASSSPGVASVSTTGLVRAIGVGTSFIVARSGNTRDSIRVAVRPRTTIAITPRSDTLNFSGDTTRFTATVTGSTSPVSVFWSSSDTAVAIARDGGLVQARLPGAAWIHAFDESGARDSARLVVRQLLDSLLIQPASLRLPVERSATFSVTALDAGGTRLPLPGAVTWSVADPSIATVDSSGKVKFVGVGQTQLRASLQGVVGQATLIADPGPPSRFVVDTLFIVEGTEVTNDQIRVISAVGSPAEVTSVTLSSLDAAIASVPATVPAIDAASGLRSEIVRVTAHRVGSTTIEARASGYEPARLVVVVRPKQLVFAPEDRMELESAVVGVAYRPTIYLGRTENHFGATIAPLGVSIRTSDPANFPCTQSPPVLPAGSRVFRPICVVQSPGGGAWLVISVDGYPSESTFVRLTAQRLRFGKSTLEDLRLTTTAVQHLVLATVAIEPPTQVPVPITVTQRHPELLRIEGSREILPGFQYTQFRMTGLAIGVDTVIASAASVSPDTLIVRISRPSFATGIVGNPVPERVAAGESFIVAISSVDAEGRSPFGKEHQLEISSDPAGLWSPSVSFVSVLFGSPPSSVVVRAQTPGRGVLVVRDTAGLFPTYRSRAIEVFALPVRIVDRNGSRFTSPVSIGFGQRTDLTVRVPPGGLQLTSVVSRDTTIARASIRPPNVQSLIIEGGTRAGTTWIVTGGPSVLSDSVQVEVGKPTLSLTGYPSVIQSLGSATITVSLRDHRGNPGIATDTVTLSATTSDASVLTPESATVKIAPGMSTGTLLLRPGRSGIAVIHVRDAREGALAYEPAATRPITVAASP